MRYSYSYVRTETAEIEIDDIGNFSLMATDALGFTYYLTVKTFDGFSQVMTYGPIHPDFDTFPSKKQVTQTWERIAFSQKKIDMIINKWLNNPYYGIVHAEIIDRQALYDGCRSITEYMKNNDF